MGESLSVALARENDQLETIEWMTESAPALTDPPDPRGDSGTWDEPLSGEKTRRLAPASAIGRRYAKGKSSLEETMLDLYYGNLSVATAGEVARRLWGETADVALVTDCHRAIVERIRHWLTRELTEKQTYVFFQALPIKQKIGGENQTARIVAAVGVSRRGLRQVLSVSAVSQERNGWPGLLADLQRRGLRGTELFLGENDPAACAAVTKQFPDARYQGSLAQLQREVLALVPPSQVHALMGAFDAFQTQDTETEARRQAETLVLQLRKSRLVEASARVAECLPFLFSYRRFPPAHWSRLHEIEPLKRVLRDFREHIRLIGPISDPEALTLMVAARLRYASRSAWARRKFISFELAGRALRLLE